jgi:hypothetical protein
MTSGAQIAKATEFIQQCTTNFTLDVEPLTIETPRE